MNERQREALVLFARLGSFMGPLNHFEGEPEETAILEHVAAPFSPGGLKTVRIDKNGDWKDINPDVDKELNWKTLGLTSSGSLEDLREAAERMPLIEKCMESISSGEELKTSLNFLYIEAKKAGKEKEKKLQLLNEQIIE